VPKNSSVAVVYLARHAEGVSAFRRFARSYARHAAGIPHDLLVIYKGFTRLSDLQDARAEFRDLPHCGVELDDSGFDIGSYLQCSRDVKQDYFCFLNTHSEIAAPEWLTLLYAYAVRSGVGIVGAMGSYESLKQSWQLIQMFQWLYYANHLPIEEPVARYYVKFPEYLHPMNPFFNWKRLLPRKVLAAKHRHAQAGFAVHWAAILEQEPFKAIAPFPNFPNPHIRSNGFMVHREQLRRFDGVAMATKDDACHFESGPDSLTARIRRDGLAAIVVGRNGEGYDVPEWPQSRTFRLGDEDNLVVTDNHGRAFLEMTRENRITHARMSWGEYLGPLPEDYPTLGIEFRRRRLQPSNGKVSLAG
jgi:hypothetical protein